MLLFFARTMWNSWTPSRVFCQKKVWLSGSLCGGLPLVVVENMQNNMPRSSDAEATLTDAKFLTVA